MKTVEEAYSSGVDFKFCKFTDYEDHVILLCIKSFDDEDGRSSYGDFAGGSLGFNEEFFTKVCTRQEFEGYAKMMELNKLNNKGQSDEPAISYISTEEYRDFNFDADEFSVEFAKSWVENNIQFTGVKETVSSEDAESKSDKTIYTQQKLVMMEESLKCIIDHLNDVGVGGANQNYHGDYDVSAINELPSIEQRVKWIALNALDLLRIDARTDEERLIDEVAKILKNTHNENLGLVKSPELFNLNAKLIIQEVIKLK